MITIFLALGLCLGLSFLISLWQGAIQTIPSSRIEALKHEGSRNAHALARVRERIEESLVALLALDVAANAGVVICSVSLSSAAVEVLGIQSNNWAIAGISVILLFGLFLFFDLLPRALGVSFAQPIALRSAIWIEGTVRTLSPIVWIGRAVIGIVPKRKSEDAGPTNEDLLALTTSAARAGNLDAREARWVSNALRLSDMTVRQILTPRTVVYALPAELPLSMVQSHSDHWAHSRLPIFRETNPDEIVGFVLRRTVFDKLLQGDKRGTLEGLALPAHSVPDSMTLDHLLEWFVSKRQHIAIVRDEFQAWVGIVTLEDVLETFLGAEIVDEKDKVVDMRDFARRRAAERVKLTSTIAAAAELKRESNH
ncbi:MAG: CNNM domain-containing protein [Planctomycetota bacterium]